MERESDEFQSCIDSKLSLSVVSCVAKESIISFHVNIKCYVWVKCNIAQIPMILRVQNYQWWRHKAHNINCTLPRKRKKGFVSHALMWSVVWLGRGELSWHTRFLPHIYLGKANKKWTFKVGQSNFSFCQLSELVTAFYCLFAVTWFWWCIKFRLNVCTAYRTGRAQSTDPMSFKVPGQSKEISTHKICIFV